MPTLKRLVTTGILLILLFSACSPESSVSNSYSLNAQPIPVTSSTEYYMISNKPLVIAHRGARSLAPENTLAAARKAFEIGADMWELDVSVSKDGELFLMHDDTLSRTCNVKAVFPERKPWNNSDFTLEEIRLLDCGSWFNKKDPFKQIAAGFVSAEDQAAFIGEKAPTLQEALEYTKANNWTVNIEIKEQPDEATGKLAVEKTVALVEALGMDDGKQVVVSSFEHSYLRQVQSLNRNLPIQLLTEKNIRNLESYLDEFGTRYVNPKAGLWNIKQLKTFVMAGVKFNIWTVNDEDVMEALIDAGVNGIITDFPQKLINLLAEK